MIPLFDRRRTRLLAGLLAMALVQLAAALAVARALHLGGGDILVRAGPAAILAFACEVALRRLSEGLGLDYASVLRLALFRHLMTVEPGLVARRRHGAMLQSFVGDLTAIRQWVAEGIMRGALAAIALAGVLGWLATINPALGWVAAAIVLIATMAGLALLPTLTRTVRDLRRERGRVAAFASERLAASATVLACGRIAPEAARLARRVDRLNRAALRRAWLTGGLRALPHFAATAIAMAAVMVAGPRSGGALAGLVLASGMIGLALRDLARAAELAVPGRVALRRIRGLMALPPLHLPPARAWKRGEAQQLVLDRLLPHAGAPRLSATARQGDVVLLSGDPDLRRSLLLALGGLQAAHGGGLRWNGSDLAARSPSRRRRLVGLAMAELPLLAGSNRFNLRYRAPEAPDDEVAALARDWGIDPAGHHGAAAALPPALARRLSLARAMLGQPPVLVLAHDADGLAEADLDRLSRAIAQWPGVVILSACGPALARLANRHWVLAADGLREEPLPALTPVPLQKDHAA
jgi:ABC-type multidrug transport system fused ATPase/permease subunit